ncbi:MAG: TetR/AcrR family transcriptional regulator [Pseudomonadota bacterium]
MRKVPRQKRSRAMVARLLDATAITLAERGLDGTTTNHIAEQAGVSIGSLYQYFPDKDALVEALLERMGNDISQNFRARAAAVDFNQLRLRSIASFSIAYGMNLIKTDPLIREVTRNWNRVPINKLLDPLERFFLAMALPYFVNHYRDYPVQNLEAKLYVLINSTLFTTIRFLVQENTLLPEAVLIRTLTDMIVALLELPAVQPDIV